MWITKLKKQLPLIILLFVVSMVCVANYVPNTWLTGWDNLHPEFNFALNAKRAFFSVWQEYQGLGLLSGMAHAADFFRVLFLWLMSLVIPAQLSRYFYHFLMLFVGSLGTYFFIKNIALKQKTENKKLLAMLGASFYLLNFGTVQYFFTPFEPFSTFWGFFPWELYVLFQYLFKPNRRNLLILAIVNLLASAQAYVQPLFVVYGLIIGLISLGFLKKNWSGKGLKTVFIAGITVLLVNAFWLLPNAYFVLTKVSVTQNAMNNRMNTERFFQWSKGHGNIKDFVLFRNMPFDDSATKDKNIDYMKPWRDYYSLPLVEVISAGFFIIGVLGVVLSKRWRNLLLPSFVLIATGLLSETPVFDLANQALRQLPLISQVLRNPFTKLVVPLIFLISIGICLFAEKIINWLKGRFLLNREFLSFCFGLIILISLPIFSGNLFSGKVRQAIPNQYFNLFQYFKKQNPNVRIMNLPQDSYWGWGSYQWGSLGSGFLWYGIKQPIMDRAFDVWSKELEGYYWELVYALRTKNQNLFNQVIDKYDIGYVLFDRSYTPSDQLNLRNLYKQQDLLTNSSRYSLVWHQGDLFVYKVNPKQAWLTSQQNLPTVKIEPFMHFDKAYLKKGNYVSCEKADYDFSTNSFFSSRFASEAVFNLSQKEEQRLSQSANLVTAKPYQQNSYYLNHNRTDTGQTFQILKSEALYTYTKNKSLDIWWALPEASKSAHLLKVKSRTVSGFPLTLTVTTTKDKQKYLLTLLNSKNKWQDQYWVLPPAEKFDSGIEIRLNNHSYNNTPSVSKIKEIRLAPFSTSAFSGLNIPRNGLNSATNLKFGTKNYWYYQAGLSSQELQTIFLSQAFDPGWRAYLNGRELKDHVLVNNWANGWRLRPEHFGDPKGNYKMTIIFWPQYLQFAGFALLIVAFMAVFFYQEKGSHKIHSHTKINLN